MSFLVRTGSLKTVNGKCKSPVKGTKCTGCAKLKPTVLVLKQECKSLDIHFHLLHGSAGKVLPGFVSERGFGAVVTDFSPLREPLKWLDDVKKALPDDVPLIQVNGGKKKKKSLAINAIG